MLDFLIVSTRDTKRGAVEVYPNFKVGRSADLMIRGKDFYAIWNDQEKIWSTDEEIALELIDRELDMYAEAFRETTDKSVYVLHMWDSGNGFIDRWHKFCQKHLRDHFIALDEKLIFSNDETDRKDYSSKRLSYPLAPGPIPAYEKLISTLYSPEERRKLEWAIGAIVTGDSKKIQKFLVLYGSAGTGKSTILNIIQMLFNGYCSVFDAKALGSSNNSFALEAFKSNPLVAIQHDGDLSRIEDNTQLNSLVSHEQMMVNEKFKAQYTMDFKCFLFMGTNRPVKITDAKSGLIRRLIDVEPSGEKLSISEYNKAMKQVEFELGGIACHCRDVYNEDPHYYDTYTPTNMMGASNDFYNFVVDSYHIFKRDDGTTLKAAWEQYRNYCDEASVNYPLSQRNFKEELKNYFRDFDERFSTEDGQRVRSYYSGFRTDKFVKYYGEEIKQEGAKVEKPEEPIKLIEFVEMASIFDTECKDCPAQYANAKGTPTSKWEKCETKLSELDTSKLHYVKVPENHIVIDFDIPDENGNKCYEKNLKEASKWPPTYAEISKSGEGIHLHYIYQGDASKLSRIYDDHIEIKVFTGGSSLRRMLTKCNGLPISPISSGLPLKEEGKVVNFDGIKNEKMLRTMIKKNLNKEYHASTKPSVDYIKFLLDDAYDKGISYDVSDMSNAIMAFAAHSSNQATTCIKIVKSMKFKSEDKEPEAAPKETNNEPPIVFYDVEVFPNLFLINWKYAGSDKNVVRMINPTAEEVEGLLHYRLIGYNCRRYDNHILYGRLMGHDNEQLYKLSKGIVEGDRNAMFRDAYNLSYTDVYDFAAKKQSLKKWEIELGIHHQELGMPWDQPVPEDKWIEVAEYCDNDVIATEAVFDHLKARGDFTARQILADLAGGCVNDTTNTLTGKIIFGSERKPQSKFNWRDLSKPVTEIDDDVREFLAETFPEMMAEPHGPENSILPYFEGYKYEGGKSTYKGVVVGEGGRVTAHPGIYTNVALLDITSMHPHSAMAECLFGAKFTRRFKEIVYGRVHIKHEAWNEVNQMLDGKLSPYIQKVIDGEMRSKDLANALKIAINSVYGLTAASFENLFKDPRNCDNIVAKRGALFMVDLQEEVEKQGFTVAHIKTDSIKIPDATPEIIQFVMDFGKRYGYNFEHEATYDRMCLVNDAVYIAKYKGGDHDGEWTATGTQFQVPYVFKTLFSKEPIEFGDICETKSVSSSLYLKKSGLPDDVPPEFIGKIGLFCPIKPNCGGGELLRASTDADGNIKFGAATGTKGYEWLEAEVVKTLGKEDDIDKSYYENLVNAAVDSISQYGDFEWFVSDDVTPDVPREVPIKLEARPWVSSCGRETCEGCPELERDNMRFVCNKGYDVSDCRLLGEETVAFDVR